MPIGARRPCTWLGCKALVSGSSSRCEQHPHRVDPHRLKAERDRGSANERGYTSAWTRARDGYLRLHPTCVRCEAAGIVEPATVVDHIVPHKGDKALFWERDNWQSLCKRCHDRKTATEDGGWGRPMRRQPGIHTAEAEARKSSGPEARTVAPRAPEAGVRGDRGGGQKAGG